MRCLEDQEESTPIGGETGLSVPDEDLCRWGILMSQFKTKPVGLELDMAGEHIEKRQNGKPQEG